MTELHGKIEKTKYLCEQLQGMSTFAERLEFLRSCTDLSSYPFIETYIQNRESQVEYVLRSLFAIEQQDFVFAGGQERSNNQALLHKVVETLINVESFYKPLGGLVGYHLKVLELIQEQSDSIESEKIEYLAPDCIDIRKHTSLVDDCIASGISMMDQMAEIYAVGGAGDRLHLVDEKTGRLLPAARLKFLGRTLLEGLIRDLEAREYLYYKLFDKKLITPVVLMTSKEKNNDEEIVAILEQNKYFNRPKESFFIVVQPLTPVIAVDGNWVATAPLELFVKPGGHGVIWKLAEDAKAFEWLKKQGKTAVIIRQINNPIAGIDYGLLTLWGYGIKHAMSFGFASCPRRENAQEGINVIKRTKERLALSNIEYTEVSKHRSLDLTPFPANTNILFANIQAIQKAIKELPIPGMLVNMKLFVKAMRDKNIVDMQAARLESTMQNIADVIDAKDSFLTLNDRLKTISVTKKTYEGILTDTPEGAFSDLMQVNAKLLQDVCRFSVKNPDTIIFLYHPALGPLYSIIAEKIHEGIFHDGAELQLEVAEAYIKKLTLSGSLLITARDIYKAKVILQNVVVENAGIHRRQPACYWKNEIPRKEACKITLLGNAEFIAEDLKIHGNFEVVVPDGMRAQARMSSTGGVEVIFEPLTSHPNWSWHYAFGENGRVQLSRKYQET